MEQAPQTTALPRSHVLSYVAVTDSPTRVRTVAARAVLILAVVHALAAAASFVILALWIGYLLLTYPYARPGWRPPIHTEILNLLEDQAGWCVLLFFAATAAAAFFACVRPIRRARKGACYMAIGFIVLLLMAFMLAATSFGAAAIITQMENHPNRWMLLFLIPGAVTVLLILLMSDLCSLLFWIAKNPITEKPPVPFLPPRQVSGSKAS